MECAFGEIDLRWGIFLKRLTSSLKHNFLICEGAMHIHNFLVDFRNTGNIENDDVMIERNVFIDDMCDNGIFNMVVGNDNNRGDGGRPCNDERIRHMNGIELREKLKISLANHNMHQRIKADAWQFDNSNHVELINDV